MINIEIHKLKDLINTKRQELDSLCESRTTGDNSCPPDIVLEKSQELDELIVKYQVACIA